MSQNGNQPYRGRGRDYGPNRYDSPPHVAEVLARMEELLTAHTYAIEGQSQDMRAQSDNVNQIIVTLGRVTEALDTVRQNQDRAVLGQQQQVTMMGDIQALKATDISHEQRIAGLEQAGKQTANSVVQNRTAGDTRLINILWGLLSGVGVLILGYVLQHLH